MDAVVLFPGQGSQKPGMGKQLHDSFEEAKRAFDEADEALGEKLSELCFEGSAEDLALTHNCLLYTSPSPRDATLSRMPSSA